MSVIKIERLSFSYGKETVLEDVNLEVNERDFMAIIGPNGGGKSTLLKLILGLYKPKSGKITIFDKSIEESLELVGYVPQNTNINIDFPIRVYEVVLMGKSGRRLFGYDESEISSAMESLEKVGMRDYAKTRIGALSGGQRQRVMIARALCSNPKILLLDEPTANIDIDGQKKIYELLKELNKEITVITVSHDLSVILEYASKVLHVNKKATFHDLSQKRPLEIDKEHFCEVEMLNLLGGCEC